MTALKSYFGNLGAGGGVVELVGSVMALNEQQLPPVLNYQNPDPACALKVATDGGAASGRSFLNLTVTPQGQAAVLYIAAVG